MLNGVSSRCRSCYYKENLIHGYTKKNEKHPLYNIWITMIARCENPKNSSYFNYGKRGIKVCEEWHDLKVFSRDMGKRPENCSIDRIDYNKNYCPENCRWATNKQQGRNKRNNKIIEYNEMNKCVSEWAEYLNIKSVTLYKYLERHSFEKAFKYYTKKTYSDTPFVLITLYPLGDKMVTEHAISYKDKLSVEDLNYIIKKANRLGLSNRTISRVYQEEDDEGIHVYYAVDSMKEALKHE